MMLFAGVFTTSAKAINTLDELRLYNEIMQDDTFDKYYWGVGCGDTIEQADIKALHSLSRFSDGLTGLDDSSLWDKILSKVNRICLSNIEYNGKVCRYVSLLYSPKDEIGKGGSSPREKAYYYVGLAEKMISEYDLIRCYTWAYIMSTYVGWPILYEDSTIDHYSRTKLREILNNITVKVSSIEKCRGNDEYPYKVYLDFLYEDEPLDYITFSYFDGVSTVTGQSVKDGRSVVMMRKLPAKFDVTIDCFMEDFARLTDVGVYLRLLDSKSYRSAIDGSVKRVETRPAKSAPRKSAYTGEYAEILNDIVASIKGANGDIRQHFTDKAWGEYRRLVAELKPTLARTPAWNIVKHGGVVICRELPLRLTNPTSGNSYIEDVVFRINEHTKKIESVVYKLPVAVEKGIMEKDWAESEGVALVTMLEQYRTAYYLRDLNYIKSLLKKEDSKASYTELLRSQSLAARSFSGDKVIYVDNTKEEYLQTVAKGCRSGLCSLRIAGCDVAWGYGSKAGLCIVQLHQIFTSVNAADESIVTLIIDVKSGAEPTIADVHLEHL